MFSKPHDSALKRKIANTKQTLSHMRRAKNASDKAKVAHQYDHIPCCDFCVYALHKTVVVDDIKVKLEPTGCKLHTDEEHQNIAAGCGYCNDYIPL